MILALSILVCLALLVCAFLYGFHRGLNEGIAIGVHEFEKKIREILDLKFK